MKKLQQIFLIACTLFFFCSKNMFAQSWLWAKQPKLISSDGSDNAFGAATDAAGNVYQTGRLNGKLIFDSDTLKYTNGDVVFLVKYAPNGNVVWAKQSTAKGYPQSNNSLAVTTDKSGNVYIAGNFDDDTLYLGSFTLIIPWGAGYGDTYLAKYDAIGNVLWVKQSLTESYMNDVAPTSLATDIAGNVYMAGYFDDTVTFGSTTLRTNSTYGPSGFYNYFLVKYDAHGNVKWAKQTSPNEDIPNLGYGAFLQTITTDKSGNIYMTGGYADTIVFGSDSLTTHRNDYKYWMPFLVKYDSSGIVKWAMQPISPSSASIGLNEGITVDKAGNIYTAGSFTDTLIYGKDTLLTAHWGLMVAKYSPSGNVIWTKQGYNLDTNSWTGDDLIADTMNNIYLTGGSFVGTTSIRIDKDTFSFYNPASPAYGGTGLIMKLDTSFKLICGWIGNAGGNWVTCDPSGTDIYVAGEIDSTVNFGSDTLKEQGGGWTSPTMARWQPCIPEGIDEQFQKLESIALYPNPSSGRFYISGVSHQLFSNLRISIFNILGEKIYDESLLKIQNNGTVQINISGKSSGIYFYRITDIENKEFFSGKFIINK